jgi:hypothetical protein
MPHDIYSLGVVLLELGLWQSFLSYPADPDPSGQDPNLEFSDEMGEGPSANMALPPTFLAALDAEKDTRKRAMAVKSALVALASEMLPARMGRRYTDVVLLCLRCLDGEAEISQAGATGAGMGGFGGKGGAGSAVVDEEGFVDEDGIVVGVRYIERILLRMQEISI